jgi:hypothetical protein
VIAALVLSMAFAAQAAGDPACAADTPPAMAMVGLPAVAVSGQSYTVALMPTGDGAVVERNGSTLALHDRRGVGWSAKRGFVMGARQAFSVGLSGAPFTVTGSYSEVLGAGACTRTLTSTMGLQRRVLAVVNCRRGVEEPASGLVLRCDGRRLRLTGLSWSGWNTDVVRGTGILHGRRVKVTLSRPTECSPLDGFIYGRARIGSAPAIDVDCPIL